LTPIFIYANFFNTKFLVFYTIFFQIWFSKFDVKKLNFCCNKSKKFGTKKWGIRNCVGNSTGCMVGNYFCLSTTTFFRMFSEIRFYLIEILLKWLAQYIAYPYPAPKKSAYPYTTDRQGIRYVLLIILRIPILKNASPYPYFSKYWSGVYEKITSFLIFSPLATAGGRICECNSVPLPDWSAKFWDESFNGLYCQHFQKTCIDFEPCIKCVEKMRKTKVGNNLYLVMILVIILCHYFIHFFIKKSFLGQSLIQTCLKKHCGSRVILNTPFIVFRNIQSKYVN